MANLKKFEEMLERLINEDREGAEELFHEIVVEKSRDIYESLLEDDLADDEEVDEATDEEVDESDDEDLDEADDEEVDESDDELEEDFDLDEFEVEADPMMGGDPADDLAADVGMPGGDMDMDMGDEEGEGDIEDRVEDLEDALEQLMNDFNELMADEAGEEEHGDMDFGDEESDDEDEDEMDFGGDEDEGEDEKEPKESAKGPKTAGEEMREYVEKVSAKMGDNGANTKSTVAGKNDMGGTASNLNQGGESKSEGTKGGLAAPVTKEDNAGNVNVPGAKGATNMSAQPGHGAEKKGKAPEKAGADSPINGVKSRAK